MKLQKYVKSLYLALNGDNLLMELLLLVKNGRKFKKKEV